MLIIMAACLHYGYIWKYSKSHVKYVQLLLPEANRTCDFV